MTRHPFDSNELGRSDPELDRIGERLEEYAGQAIGEPPVDLSARIRAAVELQPHPRGPIAVLLATWTGPARAIVGATVVVLVVAGALALGQLVERTREQVGATPSPSVTITPSPTPTPTPSPTPSATPSPTPTPSMVPPPSPSDDEVETETPRPSESDNSGPGGDGSDNSGPGGGG